MGTTSDTRTTSNGDRRTAAADQYRASVAAGEPLSARQLGEQFDRSRSWGRQVISEVTAATNGNGGSHEVATTDPTGSHSGNSSNSAADEQPVAATWQRRLTGLAVVVVATVAAALSYSHMRTLALSAGEGTWQATLLPLSVDGMMLAASMTALVRKRSGQTVGMLPWAALLLGVAASMAANVASAEPTVVGRAIAAWPPIALLVSLEMLLRQVRGTGR